LRQEKFQEKEKDMKATRYFSFASDKGQGAALFCVEAEVKLHFEVKKEYGAPGIGECRVLGPCDDSCYHMGTRWEIDELPEPWAKIVSSYQTAKSEGS
jgi:hypothetical protein